MPSINRFLIFKKGHIIMVITLTNIPVKVKKLVHLEVCRCLLETGQRLSVS